MKSIFVEETKENIKKYTDEYFREFIEEEVRDMSEFIENERKDLKELGIEYPEMEYDCRGNAEKRLKKYYDLNNRTNHKLEIPDSDEDISVFLKNFIRQDREIVRLLILNENNRVIDVVEFNKGTTGETNVTISEIMKALLDKKAKKFVYVHNHPKIVVAEFSASDSNLEFCLMTVTALCGIEFVDSFVVTDFDFISRRQLLRNMSIENMNKKEYAPTLGPIQLNKEVSEQIKEQNMLLPVLIHNVNNQCKR